MYHVLFGRIANSPSTSAASYTALSCVSGYGFTSDDSTSAIARQTIAVPTTLSSFRVECTVAPGAGKSYTYTIRKNLVDTALTVTISDTNTVAIDNTHSVSFAAGDIITVGLTPSGTPSVPSVLFMRALADAQPTNSQSVMTIVNGVSTSVASYSRLGQTVAVSGATEADAQSVMPCAGVFNNLRILSPTAPSAGSYSFTLRVNGVDTALTATLGTGTTTTNDLTHSVSVNAGDVVSLKVVPIGGPTLIDRTSHSLAFTPTTFGDSFIGSTLQSGAGLSTSAQNFTSVYQASNPSATESTFTMAPGPMLLKNFYIKLATAPGVGKSWTICVRKNGVDTGLTLTISDTNTTGNVTSPVQIDQGDKINLSFTPSGTPATATQIGWGIGVSFQKTNFLSFFN